MHAWRLASISSCVWHLFIHFRPIIAAYDNHYRELEETRFSRYLVCGRPSWPSVSSFSAATFASVCVHFGQQLPCIRSVLRISPGADLGFYKGGCPIHLKGAPEVPFPRKFLYFLQQNEFLRIPGDIYGQCNCKPLR